MRQYLNHLLQDIAAAWRPDPLPQSPEPEDHIAEVERYLHEEPAISLGQHCGLKEEAFPPAERLTPEQQESVVEALEQTYFSYGISLAIPEALPPALKYRFFVEALARKCFVSDWGMTTIEYCTYNVDLCPFGVKHCTCMDDWQEEVEAIRRKPPEEWTEIEQLEDCWMTVLIQYDECRAAWENENSPNKRFVRQLLRDIAEARKLFHGAGGSMMLERPEMEEQGAAYRLFFEWIGLEDVQFPQEDNLSETEVELLGFALLRLYGKELIAIPLMALSATERYRQLVKHFTTPMRKIGEMQFLISRKGLDFFRFPDLLEGI